MTVRLVEEQLGCSYVKANKLVEQFSGPEIGFLEEVTGRQRNRLFRFRPYLELFDQPMSDDDISPFRAREMHKVQSTRSESSDP